MLIDIDKLPHGPSWTSEELIAGEGEYERVHIVYKRSVIDVIRDLIGNPRFKDAMRYAPERHWTSTKMDSRVYGEMWTGNWWWRRQLFLRDRQGTIVPVIIASDKTQMTKLSGNQAAYPVYLTIGNISKSVRRRASSYATSIIGYLPIDEFKDIPGKARGKRLKGELIHRAMRSIMEPLETAGRDGVEMWCADGCLRRVYPLLAAFVGDWPEQNDMACTIRSSCPICLKNKHGRGDCSTAPYRGREKTLAAIDRYQTTGRTRGLIQLGLKPWWPWWANLPGVDFSRCITPDLLHQWHKGLFKGHAMKWIQQKIGKRLVDQRFASMPRAKDLRHFKKGISRVQQWTGRETKEMAKVFLPLLVEHRAVREDLATMIRAMLDFAYLAHAARLTDAEVQEMRDVHNEMHLKKQVLVRSRIYQGLWRFDRLPKWHMISHYADSICELGTPDSYNTESPEYLHIVYVKRGWAASNKRDAIPQIIQYCQRLEALRIHRAYLDEYYGRPEGRRAATTADIEEDGDGEEEGEESIRRTGDPDADPVEYPHPQFAIAIRPTKRPTLQELEDDYGAKSLVPALDKFLKPYARGRGRYFFLPHDTFDLWHKLTLYHLPLSFAPDEPPQRDVIRIRPPIRDAHGRLKREGVFDTALFLHDPQEFGLHRYRAGRVRAIFRLPDRLQYLYSGELVYLELFAPFCNDDATVQGLHTTSHSRDSGERRCIVAPIADVVLACHLAPRFRRLDSDVVLDWRVDLLADCHRFFFNHYYNFYTFQLLQYWRHLEETDQ
ncbi:hypothetical protein BDV93DRAFT_436496 [Ceratobasidium sp. AG-I]|nr:hypothetical protein BDV93DRAFT_436496 [Ceratobasidium sp. AG-I]